MYFQGQCPAKHRWSTPLNFPGRKHGRLGATTDRRHHKRLHTCRSCIAQIIGMQMLHDSKWQTPSLLQLLPGRWTIQNTIHYLKFVSWEVLLQNSFYTFWFSRHLSGIAGLNVNTQYTAGKCCETSPIKEQNTPRSDIEVPLNFATEGEGAVNMRSFLKRRSLKVWMISRNGAIATPISLPQSISVMLFLLGGGGGGGDASRSGASECGTGNHILLKLRMHKYIYME